MTGPAGRDNLRGAGWLFADMALNIWALGIVKALGAGYPPSQIVFLRAVVGLVLLLPFLWRARAAFGAVPDPGLQVLRVALSALTLTASYFAIARVPLALFTTGNFTRPFIVMLLAALVLRERIRRGHWIAAGVALVGIVVAVDPAAPGADTTAAGLLALAVVVLAGSAAIVVTRRLRATPILMLMGFYALGLALCTAPFALAGWVAVPPGHLVPLLAVGVFAQAAQACFLRAHFHGEAGVLSVLGYMSLPLSVAAGWFAFGEAPTARFLAGAALIVGAAASVGLAGRAAGRR